MIDVEAAAREAGRQCDRMTYALITVQPIGLDAEEAAMTEGMDWGERDRTVCAHRKRKYAYLIEGEEMNSTSDERVVNNAVRHEYRLLSAEEKLCVGAIKDAGLNLLDLITASGAGREFSIARTKVEEAVMWAVKGVTA